MKKIKVKRVVYILAFVFLGFLLQLLIHAGIEVVIIRLLLTDYQRYSLGWNWAEWVLVHHVATVLLLLAGLAFGWWQGRYWWRVLYSEGRWREKNNQQT